MQHSHRSHLLQALTPLLLVGVSFSGHAQTDAPNVAKPDLHPYADIKGGREHYTLAKETVNEARLYEFYQRQADYYMADRSRIPEIIPAYPGLDGGKFGHWGKHNQNNHSDLRWNDADSGELVTQVFRTKDLTVLKGICLRLGKEGELSSCFDPLTLTYRTIWEGGFIRFEGFRWGTSRNAQLEGTPWFINKQSSMPEGGRYLGFHRYGKRVVFNYQIGETTITDEPWATKDAVYRRIDVEEASSSLTLPLPLAENLHAAIVSKHNLSSSIDRATESLVITNAKPGATLILRISKEAEVNDQAPALTHLNADRRPEIRWPKELKMPGSLGKKRADSAYVVDTLHVPYDNPYKTVMQISGIAFMASGDALVSTLLGDVWRVSGLDQALKNVTWNRFATGLNQPVGIHIDTDGIFVLDRGQIYRLHDENGDGEADYYENYANDFGGYDRSHTHTFGLHRTEDGAFHFTQRESILRTGPDRKTDLQASGVRNCMGIGGTDTYFWVAPQEGTWTPASSIIEVHPNEFYGLTANGKRGTIAAPLCFIPRGVENSTGGMVEVTSDDWGPFQGNHVGISYGSSTHYLILRDDKGRRPQGAVVPLEGEFLSGSMRGAFHPTDGQLYVVGLDGWGDYSVKDGCFHRIRYTGGPVYKPSGFQVHRNGIRIDFTTKLDRSAAENPESYFAQTWNYEFAKRYGSPEFSIKNPNSLGHDSLTIRSVNVLDDGNSIFVELPELVPAMQLHLRMHLTAADGHRFKSDLFASPMYPCPAFEAEGLAKANDAAPTAIALRVNEPNKGKKQKHTESGKVVEGERELLVNAIGGLQYEQTTLEAKAGEALALKLRNTDVMPHNLVLVKPGSIKVVGDASFKMLNDPKAGEKHYVPALPDVLAFIPVIDPETDHVLHFRAPTEPGHYPYICTFPGHWMTMQGVLIVK